jgi:hypothetical protein
VVFALREDHESQGRGCTSIQLQGNVCFTVWGLQCLDQDLESDFFASIADAGQCALTP